MRTDSPGQVLDHLSRLEDQIALLATPLSTSEGDLKELDEWYDDAVNLKQVELMDRDKELGPVEAKTRARVWLFTEHQDQCLRRRALKKTVAQGKRRIESLFEQKSIAQSILKRLEQGATPDSRVEGAGERANV